MTLDSFSEWLISKRGMQKKSAYDVVSRIRRVTRITDLNLESTYDEIIQSLNNSEDFKKLSNFVQPQIKRSLSLYKEFLKDQNN